MSRLRFNTVATPSSPGTGKVEIYVGTDGRLRSIDQYGVVSIITPDGLDRNVLMNGGFAINQRLAAALTNIPSPSATARVFTGDRWGFTTGNITTPQYQQVDTIAGVETGITSRYYARFKQLTNAAKICISQVVPGAETAKLRGRVVRLQCKMRYSVGSNRTMRLGLLQLNSSGTVDTMPASFISAFGADGTDPTFGTNLALITPSLTESTGTISGSAVSCAITNVWQRFSATFLVPANCVNLVVVVYSNSAGAAADDFLFTEFDLHDGAEIFDWGSNPFELEILRCQRFFSKTFAYATVPVQSAGVTTGCLRCILGKAGATALAAQFQWRYPVVMYKTPTVTLFNPAAANAQVRQIGGTAGDLTASASANITDSSADVTATGISTGAVGDQCGIHLTADAEI
jgi:hypothetical protein